MRRGTKFLTQRSRKSIKRAREQGYNVFIIPTKKWNESDSRYAYRAWKMNRRYFEEQRQFMNDDRTSNIPKTYNFFKEEFIARKAGFKLMSSDALKNTIRSNYMSKGETAKLNIIEGLRKDKAVWKEFRERTKIRGKYTSLDLVNLDYDKETGAYVLKIPGRVRRGDLGVTDPFDESEGFDPNEYVEAKVYINYHGTFEINEEVYL